MTFVAILNRYSQQKQTSAIKNGPIWGPQNFEPHRLLASGGGASCLKCLCIEICGP